jgi:phytoene/squalene synthetase
MKKFKLTPEHFAVASDRNAGILCNLTGTAGAWHVGRPGKTVTLQTLKALAFHFGGDLQMAEDAIAARQAKIDRMNFTAEEETLRAEVDDYCREVTASEN